MPNATQMAITLLLKADITGFEGKMRKLESSMSKSLQRINTKGHNLMKSGLDFRKAGLANMAGGAAQMTPIALLIKHAADLEDKIADVAKVTNTDFGSREFRQLEKTAMSVGEHLGRGSSEVAELMANLAAGGVAKNELKAIAVQAGEIGVAFDVTAGEAGQAYMVIKNAMNLTGKQTTATLDAMNAATNKFGGKASELLNFMAQGAAGVAQTLKVSGVNMQAFGNAFQVIGKNSSEAATTMQRFQKAILENTDLMNTFSKAGGGSAGLVAILDKANKSGNAYTYLSSRGVGAYSSNLAQIAANLNSGKGLKAQLAFLQNPANVTGSANQEFINRQKTTTEQLNKLKVSVMNAATSLGSTLIPALRDLMKAVKPILDGLSKWINDNPKLTQTLLKVFAASAILKIAVGGLQFAWGGTIGVLGRLITNGTRMVQVYKNMRKAVKDYRVAMALAHQVSSVANGASAVGKLKTSVLSVGKAFSVAGTVMTGPWMLAIIAVAAAVYLVIKNWDKISAWFKKLWDKVKTVFATVFKVLAALIINFTPVGLIYKHWGKISGFFKKVWGAVKDIFSSTWEWIKNLFLNYTVLGLIIKNWSSIVDFFKDLWDRVKGIFSAAMDWIKNSWAGKIIGKLAGGVSGAFSGMKDAVKYAASHDLSAVVKHTSDYANRMGISTFAGSATQLAPARAGSNDRFSFAPVINVSGSMDNAAAQNLSSKMRRDFEKQMSDYQYNKQRKGF